MADDTPDPDPHPVSSDGETPGVDAARVVKRYYESPESVSEDRLLEVLQAVTHETVTEIRPRETELVVTVETSEGEPTRQSYTVRPTTDADGTLELSWSYIGSAG